MMKKILFRAAALFAAMMMLFGSVLAEENTAAETQAAELGEGAVTFDFIAVFNEETEKAWRISTNEATVGEALQALGLLEGEEGPWGLYIKTVDGVTADYNMTGTYWAFYVDGGYAMNGIDLTPAEAGHIYSLKIEK